MPSAFVKLKCNFGVTGGSGPEEESDLGRTSVGFAEVYEGTLRCLVWLPSTSFGSIIPSLEKGRFKEAVVRVKNFSYRRGPIDSMDLHTEFTTDDDLM